MDTPGPNFLTRDQLDEILRSMTARDIFAAVGNGAEGLSQMAQGSAVASNAFESAADRMGYGSGALDRVTPQDAVYLIGKLGEVFSMSGPKSVSTEASQPSAISTE